MERAGSRDAYRFTSIEDVNKKEQRFECLCSFLFYSSQRILSSIGVLTGSRASAL